MTWQIIQLDAVDASPWRNGGGVTRELLAWPSGRDWIWRASVAQVATSGPFSRFEGVQRWFAVLSGAGVRLAVGEQMHVLTCDSAPLTFDGAVQVQCQLLDGVTQDFNLMVRRDQARATLHRVSGAFSRLIDATNTIAVYAMDSGATVDIDHNSLLIPARSLAWRTVSAGVTLQVSAPNALWMEIAPCA